MSLFRNHEYAYIQEKNSAEVHRTRGRESDNFYRRFLIGNQTLTNKNLAIEEAGSKRKDGEVFYHHFKLESRQAINPHFDSEPAERR